MEKKRIWELRRVDIDTYHGMAKMPLTVVVDNVRSLNNIGSIFRTADAFTVEKIVLCGISATPPSVEIHKTALGAEDSVDWEYHESTVEAVKKLSYEGCRVCVLEQVKGSESLESFPVVRGERYAIVIGNEVDGVDQRVVDLADVCIEIPQHGTKHSLNVSVSAALAMWHFFKSLCL